MGNSNIMRAYNKERIKNKLETMVNNSNYDGKIIKLNRM